MILLASDYDNTLRRDGISFPELKEIMEFQNQGNIFGLVTGRSFLSIQAEIKRFQIPMDFLICVNGGLIFDKDYNLLEKTTIKDEIVNKVIKYMQSTDDISGFYGNLDDSVRVANFNNVHLKNARVKQLNEVLNIGIITKTPEHLVEIIEDLDQQYGDYLEFHQNGDRLVDINAKGVDKAAAIASYLKRLNGVKKVFVVGDSYNDIPMLKAFPSFAMKSHKTLVMESADHLVTNLSQVFSFIYNYD